MIQEYKNKCVEKGVSPVIGVILLVAVTVALVALSTVIVFNIGSDVGDSADITLDVSEQDDSVDVTVVRNENVAELRLVGPDTDETFSADVGSSATVQGEAGSYNIVAVLEDGSEETVQTITIAEDGEVEGESVEGVVETNPAIENATVEAYEDGELVNSTDTNPDGEYELTVSDREQTEIIVSVERFEYEDSDGNDIILSASGSADATGDTDFEFDASTGEEVIIDGETITVVNQVEDSVMQIGNVDQLQAMNNDLSGDYKLIRDIDASEWNEGFKPIGDSDSGDRDEDEFTGSLDGQGYEITGLYIDRPEERYVGLIGYNDGTVENIGVVNADVIGEGLVGGLVGFNNNFGEVSESYSTGSVTGESRSVGGLIGNNFGEVRESYSTGDVTGDSPVGGLVGLNNNFGEVSESYSTGSVTGEDDVGGLVGENRNSEVSESYSTGDVTGNERVGGLVGYNRDTVSESYATGSVTGDDQVGGLIGQIGIDSSFEDDDYILRDSYVLDSEMSDENKVIGEIVEGEGDGNVGITHGETDITTVEVEETFEDINVDDLNNAFIRSEEEFQDENELEQFDFDESWIIIDDYPILEWQE